MMTTPENRTTTHHLERPEGRLAYDLHRPTGPERGLVLTLPGMGDLRRHYRHFSPAVAAAGHRVADADLRGHGDSDTGFAEYGDEATAGDIVALLEHLRTDTPATVVGTSMAAGAAVIAAGRRPDLVDRLVLVGPFVRDHGSAFSRLLLRAALVPAWAARSWAGYLPRLYAGRRPDDLDAHVDAVTASLRRPGYAAAFSRTARTRHALAEAALPSVRARVLVVMGALDPDFPEPADEAAWIADRLGGDVLLVDEAGHYPAAQRPDVVVPRVLRFLDTDTDTAGGSHA
ncbi:MAG: alpha/beta fold hydrolase [Phycicoccus sp.]